MRCCIVAGQGVLQARASQFLQPAMDSRWLCFGLIYCCNGLNVQLKRGCKVVLCQALGLRSSPSWTAPILAGASPPLPMATHIPALVAARCMPLRLGRRPRWTKRDRRLCGSRGTTTAEQHRSSQRHRLAGPIAHNSAPSDSCEMSPFILPNGVCLEMKLPISSRLEQFRKFHQHFNPMHRT